MTTATPPAQRHLVARPLWMQDALAREAGATGEAAQLVGAQRVDVCIIGGGMTGLWTALHIKASAPGTEVGLLEADICGAGASGANGGFAMTWWPKIGTLKKLMGTDDALHMARTSEQAVAAIGRFCDRHGIAADFMPAGWLWAATNNSQLDSWRATIDALDKMGAAPFKELTPGEASTMSGSPQHLGGVFEAGVATVQPAALTRGLRIAALAAGVRIWEQSPMSSYSTDATGVKIHSGRGMVRADRLVLATNAWLARYREVRRHLLVLGSDVIATAPAPELVTGTGWTPGLAISDSRRLVHYYRTTGDGRIVFGKGGGRLSFRGRIDRHTWSASARTAELQAQLTRLYPQLGGTPISNAWAGAVDYSADGLPFVGHLRNDPCVSYAAGFSGNGVGPSYVAGRVLASVAADLQDEWSASPMIRKPKTYLPPEPFRFAGGHAVRAALVRKEAAEDRCVKPSRAHLLVASLDPTSFVG